MVGEPLEFKKVLTLLGFEKLKFSHPLYRNLMPNIKVECSKSAEIINEKEAIEQILEWYIMPLEDKEKFLKSWLKN